MSFSTSILTFLSVASVYIVFTFAWGWYKGRQEQDERETDQDAQHATTGGGDH
ncbi:hypothetical protein [Halomarina rubra]|uniref:Uncharacterized protein n=1 Tax=Halomarina rubra TaxID=2071873 RepID=A0ABD6AWS3_9EURY|nr:hypothetical protein [Halomarina rubra]